MPTKPFPTQCEHSTVKNGRCKKRGGRTFNVKVSSTGGDLLEGFVGYIETDAYRRARVCKTHDTPRGRAQIQRNAQIAYRASADIHFGATSRRNP